MANRSDPDSEDEGVPDPAGLHIQHRWKEEAVCWGPEQGFVFDSGWGVDPMRTYIPSADIWAESVPEWLRDRRDLVVRLLAATGAVVVDTDTGYGPGARTARVILRSAE